MFLRIIILCLLANFTLADNLKSYIEKLERNSSLKIGFSVTNLDSNKQFDYNQAHHFKMASTVKLPLAIMFLKQIEQKKINFDQLVEVKPNDLVPGSGVMGYLVIHPGFRISYRNLFEPMLTISDNSATDLIFARVGGPQALRNFLEQNNYNNIWVARNIKQLFFDARGYSKLAPYKNRNLKWWNEGWQQIKDNERLYSKVSNQYRLDFRDTATTYDMNKLLIDTAQNKVISPSSFEYLFDVMTRTSTSKARIRKYLPKEAVVADKTGSWDMADHSYIGNIGYLKTKRGLISFAIFVEGKGSYEEDNKFSEAIALIGKKLYEEF